MSTFATEFPVDSTKDRFDFLGAVKQWILRSPYTAFVQPDLDSFGESQSSVRKLGEAVECLLVPAENNEAAAIRYSTFRDDLHWLTIVVFSRNNDDAWVGVRTSVESAHPVTRVPSVRKPVIVRVLLDLLGGGIDGSLAVADHAHFLSNNDIDLAKRLLSGESGCRLPVVYVSVGFNGEYSIDLGDTARDLAGMAHVVVEPNRPFSQRLRIEVTGRNVYGGSVGVYWPDRRGRRSFYGQPALDTSKSIVEEIRIALANRRSMPRCTWPAVMESGSRLAIAALKRSGSQEIDRYVANFENELIAVREQFETAEQENFRLKAEISKYEARSTASPENSPGVTGMGQAADTM